MKNCQYKLSIFFLFIFISLIFPYPAHALEKVEIITLDNAVTSYASFGSYNQKIAQNSGGIFLTYKKTNDSSDVGIWRVMRSTDGGKTFAMVFENTHNTKPPLVEAASGGNVYIATGGDPVSLYRLYPENNYSVPELLGTIPNSASGKMSMILDEKRQQLYFFSHYAYFSILDFNGHTLSNYQMGTFSGPSANYQYPLLTLDENGILYAAWTTQKIDQYLYWDIHFILSRDGGISWQKLDGTPLYLPLIPDQTGPTDRVTLDDEFTVHTWLKSILAKNGKIYFPYQAQFSSHKNHFVRYDLGTAKKDLDLSPNWQGETIKLVELHGFCATKLKDSTFPLYCASKTDKGKIGVIVSYDQGATWHDYAEGNILEDTNPWSVSGAREITSDSYLIGTYTNQNNVDPNNSQVRFFRVKVENTTKSNLASYWPMDEKSGTTVNDTVGSHNGTSTNSIVDGKFGKARSFVSKVWNNNTKIQFPSFSANFDIGTGFTVEAWIKKDSSTVGYEHRVIGNRFSWSDPNGWYFTFPTNEKINFSTQSTNNPEKNLYSTYPLLTNTWYHIAGVYDKGTLKLYIDGELNNTVSGANYTSSNRELTIGGQPDGANYGFDGLIDEIRIYPSALSAETIRQHFTGSNNKADLNSDDKVNLLDYFYFTSAFYKGSVPQSVKADLNGDNLINADDRIIMINALKGN